MQFGNVDPARVLASDYPTLHAALKGGGWVYRGGALEIAPETWDALSEAQQAEATAWANSLSLPGTARDTAIDALADELQAATTVPAIKAVMGKALRLLRSGAGG